MIVLHMVTGANAAAALTQIKLVATRFPGDHQLQIVARSPDQVIRGEPGRRLTLGDPWRYEPSEACLAALREFGDVEVMERGPP